MTGKNGGKVEKELIHYFTEKSGSRLRNRKLLLSLFLRAILFLIRTGFLSFFAGRIFLGIGLRFFAFTRFTGILFIATGLTFPTAGFLFTLSAI